MNIFVTDICPIQSAINLDDKRVKHMPLECIELLSINYYNKTKEWIIDFPLWNKEERDIDQLLYHPLNKWLEKDKANLYWLIKHSHSLINEYEYRFKNKHEYYKLLCNLSTFIRFFYDIKFNDIFVPVKNFRNSSLYKDSNDVIDCYRRTMIKKWNEIDLVKPNWTNRDKPKWINNYV